MLDTIQFGEYMKNEGYDFYTGVPCSWMKNLINYANNECDYYNAPNEGDAVALASGAYLAGRSPVVLMQNSGLGNAISPLTSLNYIFKIPILIFVSMRQGSQTTPQHELMENISRDLVDLMDMNHLTLSKDIDKAKQQIDYAKRMMKISNQPFFIFVEKDTFSNVDLKDISIVKKHGTLVKPNNDSCDKMTRYDTLKALLKHDDSDTIYLATTGKTGRELFDIKDSDNNFYMVGSMGCVAAIGLGIALNSKKRVIVIDGDGAALMRLSVMPMIAEYHPDNLIHVLLDNNVHDSTGGQNTLSHQVSWAGIAALLGYRATKIHNYSELDCIMDMHKLCSTLSFIEIKTEPGSKKDLGRPDVTPVQVKNRLMKILK